MIGEKNENKIHTFEHTIYTQRNVFAGPNEHEKKTTTKNEYKSNNTQCVESTTTHV